MEKVVEMEVAITTPFIKLQQLIKLANIVGQGSDAKLLIIEGFVKVNGVLAKERGKKIVAGNVVRVDIPEQNESYQVTVIQRP